MSTTLWQRIKALLAPSKQSHRDQDVSGSSSSANRFRHDGWDYFGSRNQFVVMGTTVRRVREA